MANNPPQVRPWFRLASIRSTAALAPAPAPTPAQETRTTVGLPAFRTASAPSSPQTQPTQPPREPSPQPHKVSSSLPTSPLQKPTLTSSTTTTSPPVPSPNINHSPKTIKQSDHRSPKQSPNNNKHTSPPPSPLILPPSQLGAEPKIPDQAEPKTVLVQKTIDRPKPTESHKNHTKHHHHEESKEKALDRKVSDSEDSGLRVITIAGENRGAFMELRKKHDPKHHHKKGMTSSNINVDGVESEAWSGEEVNASKKDKNQKGRTSSSFPMAAYMNSNVQCVNNSLLYNASCSHHDPGVRFSLSKKPSAEGFHIKEHVHDRHL